MTLLYLIPASDPLCWRGNLIEYVIVKRSNPHKIFLIVSEYTVILSEDLVWLGLHFRRVGKIDKRWFKYKF